MIRILSVFVCVVCIAWVSVAPLGGQAGTDAGGYEVIANAFGFGVDIPGAPDASKHIREITIDELNIDVRETTTGLDVEYRTYSPGAAHWGPAKFTSACTGGRKELQQWWQEAAKGKNIRKNITVTLFKSDKSPGRTYTLVDAAPVAFEGCDKSDANDVETMTVLPRYIEFGAAADATIPNRPPASTLFRLDVVGANGNGSTDFAFELAHGGALSHEEPPLLLGKFDPADPTLDQRPRKSVTELTLRGPMTAERKSLMVWLNEAVLHQDWRRLLTLSPIGQDGLPVKHYNYLDAFPVGYVFPRMTVTNTTGNVIEEVRIKPVRCELK